MLGYQKDGTVQCLSWRHQVVTISTNPEGNELGNRLVLDLELAEEGGLLLLRLPLRLGALACMSEKKSSASDFWSSDRRIRLVLQTIADAFDLRDRACCSNR